MECLWEDFWDPEAIEKAKGVLKAPTQTYIG